MNDHQIQAAEIREARRIYREKESRELFYKVAVELISLAMRGKTKLTVAEALSVLLQTWNREYYRYRKFDAEHRAEIAKLLGDCGATLTRYRQSSIESVGSDGGQGGSISELFQAFEHVLGPVGAAKALHLLAPTVFPLWDRAIAKAYGLALGATGTNGDRYWRFLLLTRNQCADIRAEFADALKAIDEYNYCKYTKQWIST